MNSDAESARERARLNNGQFGHQPATDPGTAVLPDRQPEPLTARLSRWLTARTFCENVTGDNDYPLWRTDLDAAELLDEVAAEHADTPAVEDLVARWRDLSSHGMDEGEATHLLRQVTGRLAVDPDDGPHCVRCGATTEGEAVCRECGLGDPAFYTRYDMEVHGGAGGRRLHDRAAEWLAEWRWHRDRDIREGRQPSFVSMERDALDLLDALAEYEQEHPARDAANSRKVRLRYRVWLHTRVTDTGTELARNLSNQEAARALAAYAEALGVRLDIAPRCTETGRSINSPYRCRSCDGCRRRGD